ncbi:serine/threonine phosphatase [Leptothermofonsia sichuanensis E412]|uniref:serine/threonine phosphatase n=1 Tax=Leptothermofonsia sichuanensis TaxID=2917832 RepID=UPI001CA68012|nr:serine/threonine phosphatase [Leptothermofonsia sichuanensis]QZZ18725.1 serine/threonine phosphatase [Leptothermofonsia sichuanensis E412]
MLVCPNCQFENPNTNKFCQECGTSLTHNTCPQCGSLVPFDLVNCQMCGAIAGVTWWAIVTDQSEPLIKSPSSNPVSIPLSLEPDGFLDPQQRYRILATFPAVESAGTVRYLRVLDCQPFQPSLLEVMVREKSEPSTLEPSISQSGNVGDSTTEPQFPSFVSSVTFPAIASPYLTLQDKCNQALPVLHEAWQQNGQQILLLEDRSLYPRLTELWSNDELIIPQLQLLHWLYEMVELWSQLELVNSQQSLLEPSNLRVNEDQALCLQQIYPNPPDHVPTLYHLGRLWQILYAQSEQTQLGAISQLLADLEAGHLTAIPDLKFRMEAIADDLHAAHVEFDQMLDSDDLDSALNSDPGTTDLPSGSPMNGSADVSTPIDSTRLEVQNEIATLLEDDGESEGDDLPTVVLPMQLFSLEDAGRTDIGRQRDHNEDYFGIETQMSRLESPSGKTVHVRNLYILCDGMGGHAGGEVASALAVDTLRRYFKETWQGSPFSENGIGKLPSSESLNEAVQLANKAIYDVNQQNARSGSGRMGTTLVTVLIQDAEVAVAHVGDSRLYRYTRKRGLEQITVDHEVGQREIQRGVDPDIAYARPDAYQLTQALGPRDENFVKPDVQYFELNEDTLLLLCSDGLSDNDLLETHLKTHIEPLLSSQTNLDQGVGQLIDLANQYNGHDNITAIAIRAKVRPNLDHLR